MPIATITDWLDEVLSDTYRIIAKRLSSNDTQANDAHQAGPYIPKSIIFDLFPSLKTNQTPNPRVFRKAVIDSHLASASMRNLSIIWYNQKTRDEARITRWGGQTSPLLEPENTGALVIFAFPKEEFEQKQIKIWVCEHETEDDLAEERLGVVDPGSFVTWPSQQFHLWDQRKDSGCVLSENSMQLEWLEEFPSTHLIHQMSLDFKPMSGANVDVRLLKRRECEFQVFNSIEHFCLKNRIDAGFASVESFFDCAQTFLQRRKARSGRSFELQFESILGEECFKKDVDFSSQAVTEGKSRPDFIFPSISAYHDISFPVNKLTVLGLKTTCRDRWRQILTEANRQPIKHLLTLQEGVSETQFAEMRKNNVMLVVPEGLHSKYPASVRNELITIEDFLSQMRVNANK